MKKLDCVICGKYREFEKPNIYIYILSGFYFAGIHDSKGSRGKTGVSI